MHTRETTPIPPHVAVHVGEKTKMTPEVRKVWQQAEAAAIENRLVQTEAQKKAKERKERREVLAALTEKRDIAGILEAWNRVNELELLPNLTLRDAHLLDMHVGLQSDVVMETLRDRRTDVENLQDYIAFAAHAPEDAKKVAPTFAINESPFQPLIDMGRGGVEMVELGANERTQKEHRATRHGVDRAVHTTDIVEFLSVLDTQLTQVSEKLTSYEKALLSEHLGLILSAKHWPQLITQTCAKNFAYWEGIIGHQPSIANMTLMPEPANFLAAVDVKKRWAPSPLSSSTLPDSISSHPKPTLWQFAKNVWHLPRDTKKALNDLRTTLLGK